jgi:hypothetical protein
MDVFNNFAQTGDWMYSFVENLETVIDAGVSPLPILVLYSPDANNRENAGVHNHLQW